MTRETPRNIRIYECHKDGMKQKDIARLLGLTPGRISRIIHEIQRSADATAIARARTWSRAHKARPIELHGPRDQWLVSVLERFDIAARAPGGMLE